MYPAVNVPLISWDLHLFRGILSAYLAWIISNQWEINLNQ